MNKDMIAISRANESWQRRNFSRLMAIMVGLISAISIVYQLWK